MTRLPIATAAVCCGAAALTGSASGDADVGSRDSVADAAVMTSYAEVPEWVVAEEGGVFEGYGFNGNLYCPGETYPEALPIDTTVEFVEGDLLFSFDEQATPPGVILQSPDRGWVVASFPTDGAATYRVRGDELDHDQFESYADDPSAVDTCWPPGQAPAPESPTPIPGPDGSPVEVPASVAEGWHGAGAGASDYGRLTGPTKEVRGGSITYFERGSIVLTPDGERFAFFDEIDIAYREAGGPAGVLGFPVAAGWASDGLWQAIFEGGAITETDGAVDVEID